MPFNPFSILFYGVCVNPGRLSVLCKQTKLRRRLFGSQGHAEFEQQYPGFVVAVGIGHDRDVHALGMCEFIGVDFRKNQLFAEA